MKTSLLRQQTTSGKDYEPPLLFFRQATFIIFSCSHLCESSPHLYESSPHLGQSSSHLMNLQLI